MQSILQLIDGMTSREKAYFRKSAQTHPTKRDKNYLKLYDLIISNPNIKVGALKSKLKGTKILTHFTAEMNYLFDQVMRSLLNYNLNKNSTSQILKLIGYIEILLLKDNKERARKLLNFAKKLAYRGEDFALIIKLIDLEERILFKQGILNFIKKLEALGKERQEVTNKIQNINQLRVLKEQVRDFQYSHIFINYPDQHSHIFFNPLFLDESKILSLTGLENFYYTKVVIGYVTRNYKDAVIASEFYLQFLEKNNHLFPKTKFLPALSNYLLSLTNVIDKKQFFKVLKKLEALESDKSLPQYYINYIKYGRQLDLAYKLSNDEYSEKILLEANEFLKRDSHLLAEAQRDYFFYYMIRACIDLRKFEKAQELMTLWYELGVQEFLIGIRRLCRMIIIFELGWYQMLESEVQTSYKVLKKHKRYGRLEKVCIGCFRKISKRPFMQKNFLLQLEEQLQEVKGNKDENKLLEYIDFHRWCVGSLAKR